MFENEEYVELNSVELLKMLLLDNEKVLESGLHFDGESKIDESISVVTDKRIKMDNLMDTQITYHKVMEMRDLTETEMKYANKMREFLSKMFNIMFYYKKVMIAWTLFVSITLGIDIANGNFLGITLKSIALLVVNRPIRFIKEAIKIFKRDAKIDELVELLRDKHVLGYVNAVDDKNDIKMYAKIRKE